MKAKCSLFLLLSICLIFTPFTKCDEADDFDIDDGVTVEDDSVSIQTNER